MQPPTFLSLLFGILCLTSFGLTLNLEDDTHSAAAVNDWVKRNADNLPSNYKTFSQNSPTYRRAIYQNLDHKSKNALWTNHIDSYVSKHQDLAPEKLALIQEAKDYLTSTEMDQGQTQELEKKVQETFDRGESQALFVDLGDDDQRVDGNDGGQKAHSKRQNKHYLCHCSLGSYWACCGNADCQAPPMIDPCFQPAEEDGCGWLWKYKCDGLCPKGTWGDDCPQPG